jgi:hypothetical protein
MEVHFQEKTSKRFTLLNAIDRRIKEQAIENSK